MFEDSSGGINCHKMRSKTKQNSEDGLDSDDKQEIEQEEEQEEGRLNFAGYGKPCNIAGCNKIAIPGNCAYCDDHRDSNLKRKAATEKTICGQTYTALTKTMRTNDKWSTFLSNAMRRNKWVAITHHRW